ncbi:MAG: helix-turn-helix transcriptional regulator [Clostridia bacterium]|nr:helix-turn-helix transcriptional regulator [Clostridia bacterium]
MKETTKKEQNVLCGERVRLCRLSKGLTLERLAEKVEALPSNNERTRSSRHIGYVERGDRPLSLEWACLLAEALDVRMEYLLCKDDFRTELDRLAHPFTERAVTKSFRAQVMDVILREFDISFELAAHREFDIDFRDMSAETFSKLSPEMKEYLANRFFDYPTDGDYSLFHNGKLIAMVSEREKELFDEDIYDYIDLKIRRLLERYGHDETTREG